LAIRQQPTETSSVGMANTHIPKSGSRFAPVPC
jgi:hypothetical protein